MTIDFAQLSTGIVKFTENESKQLFDLVCSITHDFNYNEKENFESFVATSSQVIQALPQRVIQALMHFRSHGNQDGVLLIKGLKIADKMIGQTPSDQENKEKPGFETEMYITALSSVIGEIFGFGSQYSGRIIQNIMPIKQDAFEQKGTGSKVFLDWHTEDAAFEERADVIALLCLRSNPNAATTFASIQNMNLPEDIKKELFKPKYRVAIDQVHEDLAKKEGPVVSILFGRYDDPFLRLDPLYMDVVDNNPKSKNALGHIISEISNAAKQVVLEQGDLLFIDNYRVVHGRTEFSPKYDGTDRWLQRLSLAFDLRKSYHLRGQNFRIINF